ncbi:MAG: AI-2E family transporter, partial [Chloroflexota bacterium]
MNDSAFRSPSLSSRSKLVVLVVVGIIAVVFLYEIRQIVTPFLWALLAAYLLTPVVSYFNVRGGMPRIWSVILIYAGVALVVLAASRYLYPTVQEQVTVFIEDIPRLEAAAIDLVGPRPIGIDISSLVSELLHAVSGYTSNAKSASHLLVNAFETLFKLFLFLVTTFYLLMDGPRLRRSIGDRIPPAYYPEIAALARQIDLTWKQYIRGELLLFAIMATATTIGLTIFQVPGAIFLGLLSGILELLPLVGPWTAGAMAVSVAYFNGSNPWNWSQLAYAGAVAGMYFVFRQAEDYFVMPNVLGRAVRLHPVVVLFSLTTGGVIAGLFGLLIAVPLAASIKAIFSYVYAKVFDLTVEFEPVRTLGGAIIEIPIHDAVEHAAES